MVECSPNEKVSHPLIAEQIAYYRARATEYDEWILRKGRYDRGPVHRCQWQKEVGIVVTALEAMGPLGRVLEIAAGTGWFTEKLARQADLVTAVDASAETIAINQERCHGLPVQY